MMFNVVTGWLYENEEGEFLDKRVPEITSVEADGFAVDQAGTLFLFENTPDVEISNPDGQVMNRPGQPRPIKGFATGQWLQIERA
jgi:sugar lactone lactonase YvrE